MPFDLSGLFGGFQALFETIFGFIGQLLSFLFGGATPP